MATVDKLITAASSHQIYIERLAASMGNDVLPYLERIQSRVAAVLEKLPARDLSQARQLQVIAQIDVITREELQAYVRDYKVHNADFGNYEARFQSGILNDVVVSESFVAENAKPAAVRLINTATPIKLGENLYSTYGQFTSNYWKKYSSDINGVVVNAFNSGLTNQQAASQILEQISLGNDSSSLEQARRGAKTLARTGTNHMANSARRATVDSNDNVITGWLFVATLDNKTSKQCRSLDGTTYKLNDKNIPFPPLHPNCRSTMTYEIDARYSYDDDDSERPSNFRVDGKRKPERIDSKKTYYAELATLSAADQDAVLGPTLGRAFRKMSPEDFAKQTIDSLNNPMTITEMKRRDNELGRILRAQ